MEPLSRRIAPLALTLTLGTGLVGCAVTDADPDDVDVVEEGEPDVTVNEDDEPDVTINEDDGTTDDGTTDDGTTEEAPAEDTSEAP